MPPQPVLLVNDLTKGQTEALTRKLERKRKHILLDTIENLHQH